jgi:hypothetical protein
MAKYEWSKRGDLETRPGTFKIYGSDGRLALAGSVDNAFAELYNHPAFSEGQSVVITYAPLGSARKLPRAEGAQAVKKVRAVSPRRDPEEKFCAFPDCENKVTYPGRYCWRHTG